MVRLKVRVADTSLTLAQGLMWEKELPEDEGMLFVFPGGKTEAAFWGKNTYIPLDVAFAKENEITEIKEITPLSTRLIRSNQTCDNAIEANAGYFKRNNIGVGYKFDIEDEGGQKVIVFKR